MWRTPPLSKRTFVESQWCKSSDQSRSNGLRSSKGCLPFKNLNVLQNYWWVQILLGRLQEFLAYWNLATSRTHDRLRRGLIRNQRIGWVSSRMLPWGDRQLASTSCRLLREAHPKALKPSVIQTSAASGPSGAECARGAEGCNFLWRSLLLVHMSWGALHGLPHLL